MVKDLPVEEGINLGRAARRLLGPTGAVSSSAPRLSTQANECAQRLWESCRGVQVIVWVDNWFRKRFGTNPRQSDMCLNVSVVTVLHIPKIPIVPGYMTLGEVVLALPNCAIQLTKVPSRVLQGVSSVLEVDMEPEWIRVPLDIHRQGMRSLQWMPYFLTERTIGSQLDLVHILLEVGDLQEHSKHVLPILLDMDPHYRIMKLLYGSSASRFNVPKLLSMHPLFYGVWQECRSVHRSGTITACLIYVCLCSGMTLISAYFDLHDGYPSSLSDGGDFS